MIPDCDGRSDGQTESIVANTALCIARAMLTRCKNRHNLRTKSIIKICRHATTLTETCRDVTANQQSGTRRCSHAHAQTVGSRRLPDPVDGHSR